MSNDVRRAVYWTVDIAVTAAVYWAVWEINHE